MDFTLMKFFKEHTSCSKDWNYTLSEMTEYVESRFIESFNWILKLLHNKNLHELKYVLATKVLSILLVSFVHWQKI